MASVTAEGFTKPFEPGFQFYPQFGSRVPALRGFYLAYDLGDPSPGDHQINLIQVLAGDQSEDLSPNADLQPSNIPDGGLSAALQDRKPKDEEFFYRVSHSLLDTGARRFQFRDVGCVGQCFQTLPIPSVGHGPELFPPIIALVGFKLFFTGRRDHELDRIGVWFRGKDLHVAFRDRNGDDTFGYLVDFVVIPTTPRLNVSSGVQGGRARGGQKVNIPSPAAVNDFLLTGWEFNFVGGEHEIRDLGVLRSGNDVTVFYGDKNADDLFDWRLEWAFVGPRVIAPPITFG